MYNAFVTERGFKRLLNGNNDFVDLINLQLEHLVSDSGIDNLKIHKKTKESIKAKGHTDVI